MLAIWLALAVLGIGAVAVGALLMKGMHGLAAFFVILVGIGFALLVILPLMLVVGSYMFFVLAHLTRGAGVWGSFQRAWDTMKASDWRGLKLMAAVLSILATGMVAVAVGMEVLYLIPIIKWFAMIARVGFNLVFGAFWSVYVPMLAVGFIHDMEPEVASADSEEPIEKTPRPRIRRARA